MAKRKAQISNRHGFRACFPNSLLWRIERGQDVDARGGGAHQHPSAVTNAHSSLLGRAPSSARPSLLSRSSETISLAHLRRGSIQSLTQSLRYFLRPRFPAFG